MSDLAVPLSRWEWRREARVKGLMLQSSHMQVSNELFTHPPTSQLEWSLGDDASEVTVPEPARTQPADQSLLEDIR